MSILTYLLIEQNVNLPDFQLCPRTTSQHRFDGNQSNRPTQVWISQWNKVQISCHCEDLWHIERQKKVSRKAVTPDKHRIGFYPKYQRTV